MSKLMRCTESINFKTGDIKCNVGEVFKAKKAKTMWILYGIDGAPDIAIEEDELVKFKEVGIQVKEERICASKGTFYERIEYMDMAEFEHFVVSLNNHNFTKKLEGVNNPIIYQKNDIQVGILYKYTFIKK